MIFVDTGESRNVHLNIAQLASSVEGVSTDFHSFVIQMNGSQVILVKMITLSINQLSMMSLQRADVNPLN